MYILPPWLLKTCSRSAVTAYRPLHLKLESAMAFRQPRYNHAEKRSLIIGIDARLYFGPLFYLIWALMR